MAVVAVEGLRLFRSDDAHGDFRYLYVGKQGVTQPAAYAVARQHGTVLCRVGKPAKLQGKDQCRKGTHE